MTFDEADLGMHGPDGFGTLEDNVFSLFHLCLGLSGRIRDPYEEKRRAIIGNTPPEELTLEQINKLARLRNLRDSGQLK